jgi:hypothetical protein
VQSGRSSMRHSPWNCGWNICGHSQSANPRAIGAHRTRHDKGTTARSAIPPNRAASHQGVERRKHRDLSHTRYHEDQSQPRPPSRAQPCRGSAGISALYDSRPAMMQVGVSPCPWYHQCTYYPCKRCRTSASAVLKICGSSRSCSISS